MTDKKNQPDDQPKTWEEPVSDDDHTRTYYVKDGETASTEATAEPEAPAATEPEPSPPAPASEAVQDIKNAGLTPEEAVAASKAIAAEAEEKKKAAQNVKKTDSSRGGVETLASVARFRWLILLLLSLASVFAWAVESEYSQRPYHWLAWGLVIVTVILTLPTAKFLRLPTRGGLAALCWSVTFFISALAGPSETIFRTIPAALSWAGMLTMIMLWVGVAIWRILGRYKVIDIILSLILIYAATSPLWCLVDNVSLGQAFNLDFKTLAASPAFLTNHLPWYFWPMTVTVAVILPLAALFSLLDQFRAFRRRGARHGGNFFLALSFILLLPYGFLSYAKAVEAHPQWAEDLRQLHPGLTAYLTTPKPQPLPEPAPAEETKPLLTEPPVAEPAPIPEPEPQSTLSAPSSPALPPEVIAPPAEEAPPAAQAPVAPSPTIEEKLKTAQELLQQTQDRVDELERQMRELISAKETRTFDDAPADIFDAEEPAADPSNI